MNSHLVQLIQFHSTYLYRVWASPVQQLSWYVLFYDHTLYLYFLLNLWEIRCRSIWKHVADLCSISWSTVLFLRKIMALVGAGAGEMRLGAPLSGRLFYCPVVYTDAGTSFLIDIFIHMYMWIYIRFLFLTVFKTNFGKLKMKHLYKTSGACPFLSCMCWVHL